MGIRHHPKIGTIVLCDFSSGFTPPEMTKKRPTIIISKPIRARPNLCTVVAISTSKPTKVMPYHVEIDLPFSLSRPFDAKRVWVKGDMINAVGFHRIDLFRLGRDRNGKRNYLTQPLPADLVALVQSRVLHSLGLSTLTKHLSNAN